MFTFNTLLGEEAFAKTRLAEHLTEEGVLVDVAPEQAGWQADGSASMASGAASGGAGTVPDGEDKTGAPCEGDAPQRGASFSYRKWAFNGTQAGDGGVLFCGEDWGSSPVSLLEIKENKERAYYLVLCAMQEAAAPLPCVGAGGIYVSDDLMHILFMPPTLFDSACSLMGSEKYARLQGMWLCSIDSINRDFLAASLAYHILTGRCPYGMEDDVERAAAIYDKQYLPLELSINGVDASLASAIDSALDAPSKMIHAKEKSGRELQPDIERLDTKVLCKEISLCCVPPSEGGKGTHPNAVSEEEFRARVEEYYKAREKRIKASRTLRRNRAAITAAVCAAAAAVCAAVMGYRDAMRNPTMQGLSSREVTNVFYQAINEQDVAMVSMAAKGRTAHDFSDGLSQVYVTGKMRGMYESGGIITLEEYLMRSAKGKVPNTYGVYSLTNIKIDGADSYPPVRVPLRKEHPVSVGKLDPDIMEGSTAEHTARYYFVHTEGEAVNFFCEKSVDKVTLTYTHNKWRVTNVAQETQNVPVDSAVLKADIRQAIDSSGGDVVRAASELKKKYEWLPTM